MIYNPFMINTSIGKNIAYGGGKGSGKKTSKPAPTPPPKTPEQIAAENDAKHTKAVKAAQADASKRQVNEYKAKELALAGETDAEKAARESQEAAQAQANATSTAASNMMQQSLESPSSVVTTSAVRSVNPYTPGTNISTRAGQLTGAAPQISDPNAFSAASVDPTQAASAVQGETAGLTATQGSVDPAAMVQAQSSDPNALSSTQLQADQIAQAQTVSPAAQRTLQSGEMISGSAVDMAAVDAALDVQAAQANPSEQATVQGQLSELMSDFDGKSPPPWAAGALRNATAQMAQRGLGASSMAGQALVQAAMESALPIAMADAQTFAKFESQNLSNRHQTAMFAAEQRASFLNLDFNQEFQTRVANASRVADVANMNFTAEQQIALENARMAQTVDITNLNAKNAKMMADAAAMSQMDMANLNNRQQAAVMNAQAFLQMDMKNMDMEQQTSLFKAQQNIAAIFSDQAAENAAKQFNAASENQTNQFFANMATQVQQFNAGMEVQRDQFNAQNALVVAQANAQWRQNATTVNAASQNQANMAAALAANQMTQSTLDQVWQRERDIMDYAFRQSESATDRALSVFLADKNVDLAKWQESQASKRSNKQGLGYLAGRLLFG